MFNRHRISLLSLCLPLLVCVGTAGAQTRVRPVSEPARPISDPARPVSAPAAATASGTAWQPLGASSSGRVAGIAADTVDPNRIFVAAAGGGVWRSTDGGQSYTALTDTQSSLAMGAIAIAPSQPQRIYAGGGDANNSADADFGAGILVSQDGGATWTLSTGPGGVFNRMSVSKIAVHPSNPDIAYAAVSDYAHNGLCCSNTGIYRTSDGGVTWINVTASASLDSSYPWSDVALDPASPNVVYAAHGDPLDTRSLNGVYRSTDGGATWSPMAGLPHGPGIGRIALAAGSGHTLYVAAATTFRMLVSHNADASAPVFTPLTNAPDFAGASNLGWYSWTLAADPVNPNIIYCGGALQAASVDGGVTWTDVTVSGSAHALALDSLGRVLLGSDDGVRRYDPANPGWTDLNANLNTALAPASGAQTRARGVAPEMNYSSVPGQNAPSPGSVSTLAAPLPGGAQAQEQFADPNDPTGNTLVAVVASFNGGQGQVFRTTNGGAAWIDISGNLPAGPVWGVRIDSDKNQRIYVATESGVYSTPGNSGGFESWAPFGSGLPNAQVLHLDLDSAAHVLTADTHGRGSWTVSTASGLSPRNISFHATTQIIMYPNSSATLEAIIVEDGDGGTLSSPWSVTIASSSNTAVLPLSSIAPLVSPASTQVIRDFTVTSGMTEGLSNVQVVATDKNGNSLTYPTAVYVTHQNPTISSLAAETIDTGQSAVSVPVTLSGEATLNLTVSVSSNNQAVVPNSALSLDQATGLPTTRHLTIATLSTPGNATITLQVSDGVATTTTTLPVLVNAAPSVTASPVNAYTNSPASANFPVSGGTGALLFRAVSSSNSAALLASAVSVQMSPNTGQALVTVSTGATAATGITIAMQVTDQLNVTTNWNLVVNIYAPPGISAIADQTTTVGAAALSVPFTVSGSRGPLSVTATYNGSSSALLTVNAPAPAGSAVAGSLGIATASAAGSGTVQLTVSDGSTTASSSFTYTVNAPPSLTSSPIVNAYTGSTSQTLLTIAGGTGAVSAAAILSSNPAALPTSGASFTIQGNQLTMNLTTGTVSATSIGLTVRLTDSTGVYTDCSVTVNIFTAPAITSLANQATTIGASALSLPFTVSGNRNSLTLSATFNGSASSNLSFDVPVGAAGGRTLTIAGPTAASSGIIAVTVADGFASAGTTFTYTVNPAPSLSGLSTVNLYTSSTASLSAGVSGGTGALTLSAVSTTDPANLPLTSLTFNPATAAAGVARSISVVSGSSSAIGVRVVLQAVDAAGVAGTANFTVNIFNPPGIAAVAAQTATTGSSLPVPLTVTGNRAALVVSATSSNQSVLLSAGISFDVISGPAGVRTLNTGAPLAAGSTNITVQVSDGTSSSQATFTLTVAAPPLTIKGPGVVNVYAGSTLTTSEFDVAGGIGGLTLTVDSTSSALLPKTLILINPSGQGSAGARQVTVQAPSSIIGVTVTLRLTDSTGVTTTSVFTVNAYYAPDLTAITNQQGTVGNPIGSASITTFGNRGPLTLSATSSNQSVLPNSAISFDQVTAVAGIRTITLGAPLSAGTANVTVQVSDGVMTSLPIQFTVTVTAPAPPAIAPSGTLTLYTNSSTSVPIVVSGGTGNLTLTALVSTMPAVLPTSAFSFNPAGAAPAGTRSFTVTTGSVAGAGVQVSLRVTDSLGVSGSSTLTANVYTPPALTSLSGQTTTIGVPLNNVPFTISGNRSSLILTATSSNPAVLPASAIQFSQAIGNAGARSLSIGGPLTQGSTTIALTVSDGLTSATSSFVLTAVGLAQTVSFTGQPSVWNGGSTTLTGVASSGLPVVFSSLTPSVCTVNGSILTGVGNGACSVAADQPGNALYAAAQEVTLGIPVGPPPPLFVVSWKVICGANCSYSLPYSGRNRLPWQITGVQVTFSAPVVAADLNSLTGMPATAFNGLGTDTLTWTFAGVSNANLSLALVAIGPDSISAQGGPLAASTPSMAVKILEGDFNDDGVVNASDITLVNNARSAAYNPFADINGDGVVNTTDVLLLRGLVGQVNP